jgi:hypothetical protein
MWNTKIKDKTTMKKILIGFGNEQYWLGVDKQEFENKQGLEWVAG